jgi:NADH dehydrogenase FAD-containing subunit
MMIWFMVFKVASQQASYLARALNKEGIDAIWKQQATKPFVYKHLGSMASVGEWKGVYDSSSIGNTS